MKPLKIIAAMTLLVVFGTSCTCTKTAKTQNTKINLQNMWTVTHINEKAIDSTKDIPNLQINVSEMKVSGTDGCNNYTGDIKNISSDNITFGPLAATRKMCFDMTIPDKFNIALNNIVSYKIDNLNLYFYDSNKNKILSFKKAN